MKHGFWWWTLVGRQLRRHPSQSLLAGLGIALGVAVVLAVELANQAAQGSFALAIDRTVGRTTHRLYSSHPTGVPVAVYRQLRVDGGVRPSNPVVTGTVTRADGQPIQVLGVDWLAETDFRRGTADLAVTQLDLLTLLTHPTGALLPPNWPADLPFTVTHGPSATAKTHVIQPAGQLQDPRYEGLLLMDVAAAQRLLSRHNHLSHIDLILTAEEAAALAKRLPPDLLLEAAVAREQAQLQMSAAFRLNLRAMSAVTLLVGGFLIYNALAVAVVQRRRLFGQLRTLGLSRGELFALVLAEAAVMGLLGSVVGLLLGYGLATLLLGLVSQTLNDLYFAQTATAVVLTPLTAVALVALGTATAVLAAIAPAREAARTDLVAVLRNHDLEQGLRRYLPALALMGGTLLVGGQLVTDITTDLVGAFVGLFVALVGAALLVPVLLYGLTAVASRVGGVGWRGAMRDLHRHSTRTAVASAALALALATSVGVAVMVSSFRGGVDLWITDLLNADLYAVPAAEDGNDAKPPLDPRLPALLAAQPGVAALHTLAIRDSRVADEPVVLLISTLNSPARDGYRFLAGGAATAWRAFDEGAVLVTEAFARRRGLAVGDAVTFLTDNGGVTQRIGGIYYDYSGPQGRLLMTPATYGGDSPLTSLAVYAAPNTDATALQAHLATAATAIQPLQWQTSGAIRTLSLTIFDRTFAITAVLRGLVLVVALMGLVSALLTLALEREREWAMLRAVGLQSRELGWLLLGQNALLGLLAGLISLPFGAWLAHGLIFVVNRRAFGWSLPYDFAPSIAVETLVLAGLAALVAGIYPLWRLSRQSLTAALRFE